MLYKRAIALLIVLGSAFAFIYTLTTFANKSYPMMGHDFSYFIPHLFDSYIHYKVNGLSIQWYSPSFGTGLPAYPNPQHVQFTLTELLMAFSGPLKAYWVSSGLFILAGFVACYFLFESILELDPFSSAVGAVIFNINGFVFSHAVVGHLGYQAFPLLPLILLILFHPAARPIHKGILLAFILGINIHSGGFYIIVIYALSLFITIPVLIILRPQLFSLKNLIQTLLLTMLFTFMLSGSKLYAVSSLMQWFPRAVEDHYNLNFLQGLFGIFLQLFNLTTLVTIENFLGFPLFTSHIQQSHVSYSQDYGIWEFDTGISPAVLILCCFSLFYYVFSKENKKINWRILCLLMLSILGLWITTEFRLTQGFIYPAIRHLPVIKSLHINLRFGAAYLLPLSMISALGFEYLQKKLRFNFSILIAFLLFSGLSLVPLFTYASLSTSDYDFIFNAKNVNFIFDRIKSSETFHVETNQDIADFDVFKVHSSNLQPYEPIFGYNLENFHPTTSAGNVNARDGEYFNFTNPASLVFPKENNLFIFERISTSQQEEFYQFINYKQPEWKRPLIQHILDMLMTATIILTPILFLINLDFDALRSKVFNNRFFKRLQRSHLS